MAYDQQWLATLCLVTSSVIAVIANLLLIIVFFRRRGLRTVSNRFVINLLITNLLSSVLIIPLLIVDQDNGSLTESDPYNATASPIEIVQNVTIFRAEDGTEKFYGRDEEEVFGDTPTRQGEMFKGEAIVEDKETVEANPTGNELLRKHKIVIKDSWDGDLKIIAQSEDFLDEIPLFVANNRTVSSFLCYFAESCTSLICTASIFSILLIGIDQYFAVIHSLRYHSYIDKFRSLVLILTSWLLAFIFAALGALTHNEASVWRFCHAKTKSKEKTSTVSTIYVFVYFILVILVPFVSICVIYVCIYTAAHKNSKRMRKSTSSQGSNSNNFEKCAEANVDYPDSPRREGKPLHKVQSAPTIVSFEQIESNFGCPNGVQCETFVNRNMKYEESTNVDSSDNAEYICMRVGNDAVCSETPRKEVTYVAVGLQGDATPDGKGCESPASERARKISRACSERAATSLFNSLRYKISNASIFRYREESRAAKISILVIFMVLACYLPYGVALILNSALFRITNLTYFNYISIVLLVTSNVVSPFLFAYRNRRIQRELWKFFGLAPPKVPTTLSSSRRNSAKPPSVKQDVKNTNLNDIFEKNVDVKEPFLPTIQVPSVVIEVSPAKKSILKRVCSKNWPNYKNCNFITVPDSCLGADARGSFSSASTQISTEE